MQALSILVTAKELPFHDRSSGNFRLFQIVRILAAQGHAITFLARPSFRDINAGPYISELEQLGITVHQISEEQTFLAGNESQDSLYRLLSRSAFDVAYLMFYSVAELYLERIEEREERATIELYLERIRSYSPLTRIIVDSVDIHFLREQRQHSLTTANLQIEYECNKAKELNIYRKADLVVVLTDVDKQALLKEEPQIKTAIVPNIHPHVPSSPPGYEARHDIVFVGGYTHEPNIDAVEYFCDQIWPIISPRLPDCRLIIAGNAPPPRVTRFSADRIIVTGYVQDLPALLDHSRISIAPLRFGAGMKGKVGEALAYGLPVVATSIAAEGMGLQHGVHLLVSDDPADFANCLVDLYQNSTLWTRLSVNGKAFMGQHFSPEAVSLTLNDILDSLLPTDSTTIIYQLEKYAAKCGIISTTNAACQVPGRCNICGSSTAGLTLNLSEDESVNLTGIAWVDALHNRINLRENIVCRNCPCTSRHRALISVLLESLGKGPVLADIPADQLLVIFESSGMASYNSILASKFSYINTTYDKAVIDTGEYDSHQYADLQRMPYADNTFNYILTGDVLEHVRDYSAAIIECFRVLKPGGCMIFTVPYSHSMEKNHIKVLPDGENDIFLEEPEFHGKSKSLVYRVYGRELLEDLVGTGFSTERRIVESQDFGIYPTEVFICRKPEALSDDSDQRAASKTTIAIKCCTPSRNEVGWGDTYFADALASAFEHLGCGCRVDCRDEWYTTAEVDIVIHLKGLYNYTPTKSSQNILWIISHPELVTIEELKGFDLVFCASKLFSRKIRDFSQTPVFYLPQASDPNIFKPVHQPHKDIDLLFVGNNYEAQKGGCRKIIADLLNTSKKFNLAVVGQQWQGFIDENRVLCEFIKPEQLPLLYSRAKIVLNDHHPDMKREGFINNRTFDLAFSNVFQISDHVEGLAELSVITYHTVEDLQNKIEYYLENKYEREMFAFASHMKCETFTFENRAKEILKQINANIRSGALAAKLTKATAISPLISVLIPTYNRARYINDAIASALAQSYGNFEVVVVDDGSSDNTAEIVKSIENPRLRYILKEHSGAPATRNRCIVASRGEYLLWLDSDDILMPGTLVNYVTILRKIPGIDVIYGNLLATDDKLNPIRQLTYPDWYGRNHELLVNLFCSNSVPNPATLVKKTCYEQYGNYSLDFPRAHDYEFWSRLAKSAIFKHCDQVVVKWRWHDSNMSTENTNFDTRYDAMVLHGMIKAYSLQELLPTINWTDDSNNEAMATAYLVISERLHTFKDYGGAIEYAQKAYKLVPDAGILKWLDRINLPENNEKQLPKTNPQCDLSSEDSLRIIALISAHNEGDIIYHVIGDLISNGVSVYLIDNQSTDNTIQEATRWLGRGLIHIERFPEDLGVPLDYVDEYRWREILLRKEQLATQLGADWYIHADADEFRESPWDGISLHDAFRRVDQSGYNAIDFELLNFRPVDNSFVPGEDARNSMTGFEWGEDFNSLQIKAWKYTGVRVDLASHGGHNVMFPGRKIFPQRFILPHSPIRSQEHGLRKVFQDRKKRFSRAELEAGWHIQYDHISNEFHQFLHAPDTLITYDGAVVRQTLRTRPLVVAVYSLDLPDQACSRIRFGGIGDQLHTTIDIRWGSRFDPAAKQFNFDLALGRRADLIVLARFFPSPQTWNVVDEFLDFGKPVIYDVDDLLTNLDDSSPFKGFADSCVPFIEKVVRRAQLVTVSNAELKHEMVAFTPKIQVLPNLIDGNLWTRHTRSVTLSSRIVIGYAGGFTHKKDLEIIETALEIIAEKYRDRISFVFMGCATDRIARLPGFTYLDEVMDYAGYAEKLQTSGIDIALAPLVDTRFNRCKSNIKWLEYSSCGFAGVFSDLPPYNSCIQNGSTGLLAENSAEKWVDAIELLILDPGLRRSIAENAQEKVMANFTLASGASQYLEAYRSLVSIDEPDSNSHSAPKVKEVVGQGVVSLTSIIILTWNQLSFTQACLTSIAEHTPEPYELIVIDNFSSDGTVAWLRTQAALDRRITVIENTVNRGFAAGCNQGIAAAKSDFILLLNNDTVVTEGWLSGMREPLERYPDAGIIGPMTNSASGVQVVSSADYASLDELQTFATTFRADYRYRIIMQRRVVGFCMLFRRELVDTIGLLDESFGSGNFEDDDYCLRAELAGYRNLIAGDVFVHHFGGATFEGNKVDYSQAMMKNMLTFKKKWALENLEESTLRRWLVLSAIENAQRLFQHNLVDDAVECLIQKGIKSDTTCEKPYIALAEILILAGRFEDALQILPEMPVGVERSLVNEIESVCYAALGEDAASASAAHLAIEKGANRTRPWNVLGTLAARQGDAAGAEHYFRRSIAADYSCGAGWLSLGMLLWGKGDQEGAYQAVRRAVVVNPLNNEAVKIVRDMAKRLVRLADVLLVISDAAQLYPDSYNLWRHHAELLAQCGKTAESLEVCDKFLTRFSVDEDLLSLALQLRQHTGIYDRLAEAGTRSISLCMIVKNEERNLPACLASLKPVVDEMIVVDTGSTDRTADIATEFGAQVLNFSWNGNFSDARNFSLAAARGAWILVMDADEVLSVNDHELLRQAVRENDQHKVCWSVMTRNYTRLHPHGWIANNGSYPHEERATGWHPSYKVRLFPNDSQVRFVGEVHEMIEQTAQRAGYRLREAPFVVHHYGGLGETAAEDRPKKETYFELGKQKLAEHPDDLSAIGELAVQAAELDLYEEAIGLWNRFLELAPDTAVALFNKGFALMRLNRFAEALDVTRRALVAEPYHKEAAFNYGICALYAGDPGEAITRLESILKEHPAHPPLLAVLTVLHLAAGGRNEADVYQQLLDRIHYSISDFIAGRIEVLRSIGRNEYADALEKF